MADKKVRKPLSNKVKAVLSVLAMLAFIGACMSAVFIYNKLTMTEGTEPEVAVSADSLTVFENTPEEIFSYISTLDEKTADINSTRVTLTNDTGFSDFTADVESGELTLLSYIAEKYLNTHTTLNDGEFGVDTGFVFPDIKLEAVEMKDTECEITDSAVEGNEDCYIVRSNIKEFAIGSENVTKLFNFERDTEKLSKLASDISSMVTFSDVKITPVSGELYLKADRLTDNLRNLKLTKYYDVSVKAEFIGEYASAGTKNITFRYRSTDEYSVDRVFIKFDTAEARIDKGEEFFLSYNACIGRDTENSVFTITLDSSDEARLTIDEENYAKGIIEGTEPVTVTATLDYLGEKYTDTCTIYVTKQVEKVVVSEDEMTLKKGDTAQISAKITPDDASIQTVTWHTEDEKVATVDGNGTITAVGKGETKIFTVTDEGRFRDSCVVTVTE